MSLLSADAMRQTLGTHRWMGLVSLLLCFSASRASAQVEARDVNAPAWTLERVSEMAIQRSPRVRVAQAALQASRAYRAFAEMPRVGNPTIDVRAMIGRPDQSAATYSVAVGLPFDVSRKRSAYRSEATWVEREAEARLAVMENEARAEAHDAFVDVVLSAELERVAIGNAEVARDFFARVKARFDARAATALDVALSQRDYAETQAEIARARGALVEARGHLREMLDLDPAATIEGVELPNLRMPKDLTLERAVELAMERRRDPVALFAAAERARVADERLRREAIAPLRISGEYEAQANQNTKTSGGLGAGAELPFILRNQGERAQMRAQGKVFALDSELTKRRVAREAMNAFLRLETALAELAAIETEAEPAAERALAMTTEMLEAGAIDYFRLLNARESAFLLRARRVEVLRSGWHQRIALERSLGGLPEAP